MQVGTGNVPRSAPPSAFGVIDYERAAQSADDSQRQLAQLLRRIAAAVPVQSVALAPVDADGVAAGPGIVLRTAPVPVTPEAMRAAYLLRYHAYDPLHPRYVARTGTAVIGTRDLGGPAAFRRTPYAEYLAQQGFAHLAQLYLRDQGELVAGIQLARTPRQGDFSEDELSFLRTWHPAVERYYVRAVRAVTVAAAAPLRVGTPLAAAS